MTTQILRPTGAGSLTQIDYQYPSSGAHWEKVDEVIADDAGTYVSNQYGARWVYQVDLYQLADPSPASGTINSVTIYFKVRSNASEPKPALRTHDTTYLGVFYLVAAWSMGSQTWVTNPYTGLAWTWQEITDLEIGIGLSGSVATPDWSDCTQVYVAVDYSVEAPTITTQAVTDIEATTATGNGNITNIGGAAVTQHGHCWNTAGTPTTADSKTEKGAGSVGAFTSSLTGLTTGTKYFVRAYATNTYGTSYGAEVNFITSIAGVGLRGTIWQEGTKTHFIDEDQAEQSFEGSLVGAGSNPEGNIFVELTKFHNIDVEGDERSKEGTATGDTSDPGFLHIEDANLHYIDEDGNERYN